MAQTSDASGTAASKGFSLDTWAVVVALFLAALVRLGIIPKVLW